MDRTESSGANSPIKVGFIAVIGRPNAGKSTLVNALVGEKVAITSPKPQTTRNRIVGIKTTESMQMVFLDTPGIHEPRNELQRRMVRSAFGTLLEADAALFVLDASKGFGKAEEALYRQLAATPLPLIVALNKVDIMAKEALLPLIAKLSEDQRCTSIIPISALQHDGLDRLETELLALLPEGQHCYDPDQYTDLPERFFAAELIREQLFHQLGEELPYAVAVRLDLFEETPERTQIMATIYVEKEGQKRIVVGKGGSMIKTIGTAARKEIMAMLDRKVHLELYVKVEPGWTGRSSLLAELGYEGA